MKKIIFLFSLLILFQSCFLFSEWTEIQKIYPNGSSMQNFGTDISINDSILIVGNHSVSSIVPTYIFHKSDSLWFFQNELLPSDDIQPLDFYGKNVAISDSFAFVSAHQDDENNLEDSGSVYVFKNDNNIWIEQNELIPNDQSEEKYFGVSLAIDNDYLFIGAYGDDSSGENAGAVYVFKKNIDQWIQHQKLIPRDCTGGELFGTSVAVDGEYAVIGAVHDDDNGAQSGSAYVYKICDDSWIEHTKLVASDGQSYDYFGTSTAISDSILVIGAMGYWDNGYVYLFKLINNIWFETQKIDPGLPTDSYFGSSVSLVENSLLIGAYNHDIQSINSGSVFLYKKDSSDWELTQEFKQESGSANDRFGISVAQTVNDLLIGASGFDTDINSGCLNIYKPELKGHFSVYNTLVNINYTASFFDESSEGLFPITIWQWDFENDGTIDSYNQNPEWIYNEEGTYTVSLNVTDSSGETSNETKVDYITVINPPDIEVQPSNFNLDIPPNDSLTVNLSITNNGGSVLNYIAQVVEPDTTDIAICKTNPNKPTRQGGEDISSAFIIPQLPYLDSGTTNGYVNNYDEECPYSGSTAPDVVYSFTPNGSGTISVDLCGSSFDTKLYIFENDELSCIACNDDYYTSGSSCGNYVSALFDVTISMGNTYYIVIDGYGSSSGNYNINIMGNLSVEWLQISGTNQISGFLNSGEYIVIPISINTEYLDLGTFQKNIKITSDDPDEPLLHIPVIINVIDFPPSIPSNVIITTNGLDVHLEWSEVDTNTNGEVINISGYYIYKSSQNPDTAFQLIATVPSSETTYIDINALSTDEKAFYKVSAFEESSENIDRIKKIKNYEFNIMKDYLLSPISPPSYHE